MSSDPLAQTAAMVGPINDFLSLIDNSPQESHARLRKLAEALDSLVSAYHGTADVDVDDDQTDAPKIDYQSLYQRLGAAFPELGYYAQVDPIEGLDQRIGLADAIDDLADIAKDLTEVLWHIENNTASNAVWEFRFGYQTHWGTHLHRLRGYLHTSTIAAW